MDNSVAALSALNSTSSALGNTISQLASGSKINNASDNPSGLAIATALVTETTQNEAVGQVGSSALSQLQTSTSNLGTVQQLLTQASSLVIQSTAPGANVSNINAQYQQVLQSIDQTLQQGGFSGTATPITTSPGTQVTINRPNLSSSNLGLSASLTGGNTGAALNGIDQAMNQVNQVSGQLAATQNLIQGDLASQQSATLNSQAALSAVADSDIGAAVAREAQNDTQRRAAMAAVATANKMARETLQLFK